MRPQHSVLDNTLGGLLARHGSRADLDLVLHPTLHENPLLLQPLDLLPLQGLLIAAPELLHVPCPSQTQLGTAWQRSARRPWPGGAAGEPVTCCFQNAGPEVRHLHWLCQMLLGSIWL